MWKRIKRYFYTDFPNCLPSLIGTPITLITKDGVTLFGIISQQKGDSIIFEDKIPRTHCIEIKNIYEIVQDREASY